MAEFVDDEITQEIINAKDQLSLTVVRANEIVDQWYDTGNLVKDAPQDGQTYGRKNGEWAVDGGGAGTGDMKKSTYDPDGIELNAFDRANHTGECPIDGVEGLEDILDNTLTNDSNFTTGRSDDNIKIGVSGMPSSQWATLTPASEVISGLMTPEDKVVTNLCSDLALKYDRASSYIKLGVKYADDTYGTQQIINPASTSYAGVMTSTQYTKLNGIAEGAQVNSIVAGDGVTVDDTDPLNPIVSAGSGSDVDLAITIDDYTGTVTNTAGTGFVIPTATISNAGLFSSNLYGKLSTVESYAQVNTLNALVAGTNVTIDTTDPKNPIINATGGGTGGGSWGSITGTLSDQTDLQDALDDKIESCNLTSTSTYHTVSINSSEGTDVTLQNASSTSAGIMDSEQAVKLEGIETGAEVNVGTDLYAVYGTQSVTLTSSTGDNVVLNDASATTAGCMNKTQYTKLDGVEDGAEVNTLSSITAGSNITIDSTDPLNPVISASGGGSSYWNPSSIYAGGIYAYNGGSQYIWTPTDYTGDSMLAGLISRGIVDPSTTDWTNVNLGSAKICASNIQSYQVGDGEAFPSNAQSKEAITEVVIYRTSASTVSKVFMKCTICSGSTAGQVWYANHSADTIGTWSQII